MYLVGAGPGDPGLMTARALELISLADVILYDRLIPDGALDGARADAELVFVGKEGGGSSAEQPQIEELMLERARAGPDRRAAEGRGPVRVRPRRRGGARAAGRRDPVRGRPGRDRRGRGARLRGHPRHPARDASAVALVTGHEDPAKPESALDWEALAAFPGTLVLYMGVARLAEIAARPDRRRAPGRRAGRGRGSGARCPPSARSRAPLGELAERGRARPECGRRR